MIDRFIDRLGVNLAGILAGIVLFVVLCAAIIGAVTVLVPDATAHAYVGPRPTIELVRVFECNTQANYNRCSQKLEERINGWLQEKQPGIRIVARSTVATQEFVFISLHYEVLEWRTKQPKPPAEKP